MDARELGVLDGVVADADILRAGQAYERDREVVKKTLRLPFLKRGRGRR